TAPRGVEPGSVPAEIEAIEADALACRTAAEAVQVYKIYLADKNLPVAQRRAAEKRLETWLEYAEEKRRRLGKRWVTEAEYEDIEQETERLITHSFELWRLNDRDLCKAELIRASRLHPESGKADFIMGLIYTLVANNDIKAAEHFTEVIKREPNNAYAYNNLAVSEVFTRRYGAAARHFKRALEIMPDLQDVCDNLGVAIGAGATTTRFRLPDRNAQEINELYRWAIHDLQLKPYDPRKFSRGGGGPGGPGDPAGGGAPPGGPPSEGDGLADGATPAPNAVVTVAMDGPQFSGRSVTRQSDADGRFSVGNIALGPFTATVQSGALSARAEGTLAAGGSTNTVTLALFPAGSVLGRIVRAD
ncbi:MAG: hypothetical protein EBR86_17880, partial [Planctomycetia bacterium]|nr:hypothetical protein [Planctomycetia bacterium]